MIAAGAVIGIFIFQNLKERVNPETKAKYYLLTGIIIQQIIYVILYKLTFYQYHEESKVETP